MTSPRGYDAGTAFLAVIPSFRGVQKAIEREVRGIERSLGQKTGDEFGKGVERGTAEAVDKVLGTDTAKKLGKKAGDAYAGQFSTALKKAVGEAQREVRATIKLVGDDKDVQRTLREISNELNKINKAKIGIDLDAGEALAKAQAVEAVIQQIQREAERIDLGVNAAQAQLAIQRVAKSLRDLNDINIVIEPEIKIPERQLGQFERTVKRRIEAATKNIPPIEFDADVTPAQNKLQQIRHELQALNDKKIGIDIGGTAALAELERLRVELEAIKKDTDVDIQVRADAAAAMGELAAVNTLVELVDGKTAKVKVEATSDTAVGKLEKFRSALLGTDHQGLEAANSFRSFNAVILAGAALLPAVVPLLGAAAGALALIGPAAIGGAAGLGALIFAFGGVGDAVKALGNQRENGAREAVASARTMRDASQSVADAERGVGEARAAAGRSAQQAARAVADAVDAQRDAEQDLVRAQGDVVRAQEEVNRAREQARERIEDLALSIRGGALAERQAILDLKEAQADYDANIGAATGDDREQLIIDLEQAKLRVDSLRESNADMAAEQAEFNRTGVEGSDEVRSAQEGVAAAQQAVADATARVADASVGVQDALIAQQQTNADNARSIAEAQRTLTTAQQRYSDALYDTGTTGAASAQAVQEAFAKLGPAGKIFSLYIDSLRDDMRGLRDEVQAGFFPGLQEAIDDILTKNGPLLTTFMRNMGVALGQMSRDFADLMTSPQWQAIWQSVVTYAPQFMQQFGAIGGSVLTIFGELFRGLAPYTLRFGDSLVDMAASAEEWVRAWIGSPQFKDFMEWLFKYGPIIFEHIMSIIEAMIDILIAAEPLGQIILGIIGNIADFISELDPKVLGAIVTTILGLVVAFQLAHGAVALLTGATAILQSPLSKMVFFFGALVTALGILYTQSETVRAFFDWLVDVISDLVGWFADLPGYIQAVVIGLGAMALLRGPLGGVLTSIKSFADTAALKFLYARDSVGQLGTKMSGLGGAAAAGKKGLGGLSSFLGGPWALAVGGAVIGLGALVDWLDTSSEAAESAKKYQEDLTTALRNSGGAIDENLRALAAQAAADQVISSTYLPGGESSMLQVARDLGFALPQVTDALLGNAGAYESLRDAANKYIDDALLAENAGDMGMAENAEKARLFLEALEFLAPSMGLAVDNAGLLAQAQGGVATETARINEELAEEAQWLITLAEANIGSEQAAHDLAAAHKNLADVLADETSTEEDIYNARQAIINQSQASYRAAARVAEARHADATGVEAQHWANAAILADLIAQEEQYGTLPPLLQDLKESLEGTVPASFLAATEFENLGLAVIGVPDEKSIIVESTTQEQRDVLALLGYEVTHLEDGTFKVTAITDEAQLALDKLDVDRFITVTAEVSWASRYGNRTDYGTNYGGGRAQGGPIYGPGGPTADVIPILASNGEYMIKAAAVRKYGLGFLDMVNAGKYAMGGLIGGRRKYAEGGLVANWGGSISLDPGDTNPLALIWFDAIQAINAAAAFGSAVISMQFARLRDSVLATMRDLRVRTMAEWNPFMLGLISSMNTTRVALISSTTRMNLDTVNAFRTMRTLSEAQVAAMVGAIGTHFARLPRLTATPVNAVIDRVLNRGLFAAFNGIIRELGLNKEWTLSPAAGVNLAQTGGGTRLAAGGRVPGWSPHDKADNVPAMLTAGEWVQPVDAVDYYGPDFMEAIRRRAIPRDMFQYRATGGQIYATTLAAFPRAKLNSSYRPGDPGYHGRNMAADMGEAGFAGGLGRAYIAAMKRWWVDNFGRMANEIIYDGLGNDRPDIYNGLAHTYNAATRLQHANHLHVAVAGALGAPTGAPTGVSGIGLYTPPGWYSKYGSPEGVLRALQNSIKAVDELTAYGKPGKIYDGMADKAVEFVWSKVESSIEGMFAGIAGAIQGALAPASGASGPVVDIVRSVASKYGWGEGNEWNALSQLIQKESSWNPNAQNPTSTAYGLFQFLNGTWAGTGIGKTSDPGLQTEAGMRYIRGRYGSPSQALAFHLANNWYSEGGEVTADANADAPTLYDTGGWLPPGITTVLNATNKPEPILTSEQWDELTASRGDGGGYQTIGQLHLHQVHDSLEDAVAEVNHWASVYDKQGGRYAPTGGGA